MLENALPELEGPKAADFVVHEVFDLTTYGDAVETVPKAIKNTEHDLGLLSSDVSRNHKLQVAMVYHELHGEEDDTTRHAVNGHVNVMGQCDLNGTLVEPMGNVESLVGQRDWANKRHRLWASMRNRLWDKLKLKLCACDPVGGVEWANGPW